MNLKRKAALAWYNAIFDEAKDKLPEDLRSSFEIYRHPATRGIPVEYCSVLDTSALEKYILESKKDPLDFCERNKNVKLTGCDFEVPLTWKIQHGRLIYLCEDRCSQYNSGPRIDTSFFTDAEIETLQGEKIIGVRKIGYIDGSFYSSDSSDTEYENEDISDDEWL